MNHADLEKTADIAPGCVALQKLFPAQSNFAAEALLDLRQNSSTPSPITFCPKNRSAEPVTSQKRVCVGRLLRHRKTQADFDVASLSLQAIDISSVREKTRHFYLRTEISISAAFVFELKRRLARISKKGCLQKGCQRLIKAHLCVEISKRH